MSEFKENKDLLTDTLFEIYSASKLNSHKTSLKDPPDIDITVQGGVGTSKEHQFLMDYYNVDSVGWGSPFLLVPEVVNIDNTTMELISRAEEDSFYLSNVSPLGVPFNTIKGNSADLEKQSRVDAGRPGAPCLKKHLFYNTEFTEKPICTASRQYQKLKIEELKHKNLDSHEYEKSFNAIVEKVCLCVGLGNGVLTKNNLEMYPGIKGVAVCPGPNMAYFSKIATLHEMVDHIYGRSNLIKRNDRPHMFVQELKLYITYLRKKMEGLSVPPDEAQFTYFQTFKNNLNRGIQYYKNLFSLVNTQFDQSLSDILNDFEMLQNELNAIKIDNIKDFESQNLQMTKILS